MMMEIAIKGFLVFAVAGLASVALRRRAAATRHLVWCLAVISALALPVAVVVAPRLALPVAGDSVLALLAVGGPSSSLRADQAAATRPALEAPDELALSVAPEAAADKAERSAHDTAASGEPRRTASITRREEAAASSPGPAGVAAGRERFVRRLDLGATLPAFWLAGVLLVLTILAAERLRLAAVARRTEDCTQGPLADAFARVCREAGLRRRPRLCIGSEETMPMTWGSLRPVVLLPAVARSWSAERLQAVLRHEIAHVRRGDDALQLAAVLAAALHWFDPLAWVAVRRMRIEREHACDDEVLRLGARPSAYAEELLDIAHGFRPAPATGLAAQSMARRSQLRRRLTAVLEDSRRREALSRRALVIGVTMALVIAAPLASLAVVASSPAAATNPLERASVPAETVPFAPHAAPPSPLTTTALSAAWSVPPQPSPVSECWTPSVNRSSRNISSSDGDLRTIEWESDNCRAELRLRGELAFNDDFTAIEGISDGGSFLLVHREGGIERRLEIVPGASGAPRFTWRVDGRDAPFDEEAQRWFSGILVSILRASGIAADERTAWIYRDQGAEGVFREVALMPSNSTKGRYLTALAQQPGIDDNELVRILDVVDRDIHSNTTKGRLLAAIGARYPHEILDGPLEAAYWRSVAGIDSNSATSRLLSALIEGRTQDDPMVTRVLREAGERIDSNSTLASFLRRLERVYPAIATSGPQAALFWQTVARIDSNSTVRSFLLDLGENAPVDSSLLPVLFDTARARIDSNSTLADFLRTMKRRYPDIGVTGPVVEQFWSTVDRITSDSTLSSLLLDLAAGEPSDSAMLDRVLATADRELDSSSRRHDVLVSFASAHREAAGGRLREQVLEAARRIDSRSTRERTLRALSDLGIG